MKQDEIIEMARRARLHRNQHNLASNPVQYKYSYDGTEEALIAFAKLVAAKERDAIWNILFEYAGRDDLTPEDESLLKHLADLIKARGEQ